MELLMTSLDTYMIYIVLGLAVCCFILFIMLLVCMSKVKKVQRKYETFMLKEDVDLENLLIHYAKKVNQVKDTQGDLLKEIERLTTEVRTATQKVGIVRYNAIEKVGADLSFAIALLDAQDDGVVLNGIYSRDGSYIYAKPIKDKQSTYTLSDEEKEAIERAIENNKKGISK